MTQQLETPTFSPLIHSVADLEHYFHAGGKERSQWRIGVEYEKPVVFRENGEAVPYEGPRGIGVLLSSMRERFGWEPIYENGNLVALWDGKSSITLEPGGQLEMSGQQCESLHCAAEELRRHVEQIVTVGNDLDLDFLGLGITPKTPITRMPWMPKQRYRIMRSVMRETGNLGHRMMQQTATVQSNFDYYDEQDARKKIRVAMAMSPVLVAMSANSPIADGVVTGYKSFRAHIWRDTDPNRCGILPFVFDTENLFGAYADWALDVPMYFIWRDDRFVPARSMTFRQFLTAGLDGHRATLGDWAMHLTTLFPEARLKTYLEVRAADSQTVDLMLGTPALMKGILYDDDCLEAGWDVVRPWTLHERLDAGEECARLGLDARVHRHKMRDLALELVNVAREGLRRQAVRNGAGEDETRYLEALGTDVAAGVTPADRLLRCWSTEWNEDFGPMLDSVAYRRYV